MVALGTVGDAGLNHPVTLAAAEMKVFTVDVPEGINNLQFRLNNRSGEANIAVLKGNRIPLPGLLENYGVFGGETAGNPIKDKAIVNLGNPAAGIYTVVVRAGGSATLSYANASATLSVEVLKPAPLNFGESLNAGNGLSNVVSRSLNDKEKYFYRVAIPQQLEGAGILGWLVTVEQGNPIVRFHKAATDFGKPPALVMTGRSALLVPPYLTLDSNWFIEVEGVGTTDFILRSQPVTLGAAPWTLPAEFNKLAGDSNPGQPDGQGAGLDLAQDHWGFYALDVTEANLGLLRIALEASNGNPNVYLRSDGVPTTDHQKQGASGGVLYDYRMVSEDSEAGNFSELGSLGTKPRKLKPGRWYLGVKSEPANNIRTSSRYRIKAHSGVVTDLDLTTMTPASMQNLAEKDWRYYRFHVPRTGIPVEWRPLFTRLNGTAQMYIRDTLPPFSYLPSGSTSPVFVDWGLDAKNKVAATAYKKSPAPGAVPLTFPPVRPGETYYLGFYGATGGAFDVSSSVSPESLIIDQELAYDVGTATLTIEGNGKRVLRIPVPAEATRFKLDAVQSVPGLSIKLEQGTLPDAGTPSHRQNATPYPVSYTVNEALSAIWPLVPDEDYYLLLSNTTTSAITTTINLRGKNLLTEDEDNDTLRDAWERQYFNSLVQTKDADPDSDGSTNFQEQTFGTIPNDRTSVLFSVVIEAPGGAFSVTPQQTSYAPNTGISLTACTSSWRLASASGQPGQPY